MKLFNKYSTLARAQIYVSTRTRHEKPLEVITIGRYLSTNLFSSPKGERAPKSPLYRQVFTALKYYRRARWAVRPLQADSRGLELISQGNKRRRIHSSQDDQTLQFIGIRRRLSRYLPTIVYSGLLKGDLINEWHVGRERSEPAPSRICLRMYYRFFKSPPAGENVPLPSVKGVSRGCCTSPRL